MEGCVCLTLAQNQFEVLEFTEQCPVPSWGLDRIDGIMDSCLVHGGWTGQGVTVFLVDSGIRATHSEFGDRVRCGYNAIQPGAPCTDLHGHGTHVSGTVGGSVYGVAKEVDLVDVKVFDDDGTGTMLGLLQGLDYIIEQARKLEHAVIANLSLGGSYSTVLNNSIDRATQQGVFVVVAAGNEGENACGHSPASANSAFTVGATGPSDTRSSNSNYGACVDIFAPGESIESAYHYHDTATSRMSGTSMSAAHATGIAALYLERDPTMSPWQIRYSMEDDAEEGVVQNPGPNSPNLMASMEALLGANWTRTDRDGSGASALVAWSALIVPAVAWMLS